MNGYTHILLAADLAADHEKVLPRATNLARIFSAKLTLMHVVDEREAGGELQTPIEGQIMEPGSTVPKGSGPLAAGIGYGGHRLKRAARAFLDDLARETGLPDVATEVVASSTIGRAIVAMAKEQAVDLVVLGGRPHAWLLRLFGTTTDAVVHRAPCDVLVVHE